MRSTLQSLGALFFFLTLMLVSQWRVMASFTWRYPALNKLVASENLAGDLGALLLGAHRLAADIAYIQFLQYYGVPEAQSEEKHDHGVHDEHDGHHQFGGGVYAELKSRATRFMCLDPFFNGAILEAAGALAFNVLRPDEALSYLREAIDLDPSFYRYHLYVAAILYRQEGKEEKLIEKLQEAIKFSDCPPLLQGVLGNLLKKSGRFEEAARVYLHTYETAAADFERDLAMRRLTGLINEHPELRARLGF